MFPERFVEKNLVYSRRDDLIFDPFSGRGTTAFQAILSGRKAIASDISPVAYCISRAKVSGVTKEAVRKRLIRLQRQAPDAKVKPVDDEEEFFRACFHSSTLNQILFLRSRLRWAINDVDCFIAALVLGRLHGESHRSGAYFSNRMPRTIATKPAYSVRWWKAHGYIAPKRDVFEILKNELSFRFETGVPTRTAEVLQVDARHASKAFSKYRHRVSQVITSPPYPDTTHFAEDQWLRNWFLGADKRTTAVGSRDDRHHSLDRYWLFLNESWAGIRDLLNPTQATVVVRIGGSKLTLATAREGLLDGLKAATGRSVSVRNSIKSDIVGGQLKSFRPSARGIKHEYDFVFSIR